MFCRFDAWHQPNFAADQSRVKQSHLCWYPAIHSRACLVSPANNERVPSFRGDQFPARLKTILPVGDTDAYEYKPRRVSSSPSQWWSWCPSESPYVNEEATVPWCMFDIPFHSRTTHEGLILKQLCEIHNHQCCWWWLCVLHPSIVVSSRVIALFPLSRIIVVHSRWTSIALSIFEWDTPTASKHWYKQAVVAEWPFRSCIRRLVREESFIGLKIL